MEKETDDTKYLSIKRDSENESHPSGPYPITLKNTSSPKLTKKITSAKGRLSAIRSSIRRDVEGFKSSMRKSKPELTKSQSHESIHDEMPRKNKKSKGNPAASLVRRLSIGKHKTTIQPKEFPEDDKSESTVSSTATQEVASVATSTPEEAPVKAVLESDVNVDSNVLENFLDNLTENQPATTVHIDLGSPTASIKSDQDAAEHDKTESCDEDDNTEDNLPRNEAASWKPFKSNDNLSSMIEPNTERREYLYKILVIGELGTGKTSIIKRYVHQFFSQHYRATIGVDFALKLLNWDANTIIRLQLWDIAGQERFGNMTRVYYKEAVGAFIVFDVTRIATFDAVVKWKMDLDTKVQLSDGSPIPCILLANKCDQQKEGLVNTPAKMDEYCKERGFAGWFETSAKENINIDEAGRSLVNKILLNDKLIHGNDPKKDAEMIALDGKTNGSESSSNTNKTCSC